MIIILWESFASLNGHKHFLFLKSRLLRHFWFLIHMCFLMQNAWRGCTCMKDGVRQYVLSNTSRASMPSHSQSAHIATILARHVPALVTTSASPAMVMHPSSILQKLKVIAIQKLFFQRWKQANGFIGCL